MRILAIETSCDETAIAVLEVETAKSKSRQNAGTNFSILSGQISSQVNIHRPFGGVVPNLAKREHIKNLPVLFKKVLKEITLTPPNPPLIKGRSLEVPSFIRRGSGVVDALAVTSGPGLEPALWTGINFAQKLAEEYKLPLIPVNHLEGHIYSAFMKESRFTIQDSRIFPLLTLIVSGGHTELVLTKKHLSHKILGETLDDAAGEAFDKVARMLELPYPGGPEISKLAKKFHNPLNPPYLKGGKYEKLFPRPMINSKDLNFSFSGLKTSVLYYLRDNPKADKALVAYEFEQAVVDVLVSKTLKAVEKYKPKTVALGGGVAANDHLRAVLSEKIPGILLPEKQFTGDNAAMIAVAAYFKFTRLRRGDSKKSANPSAGWRTIKAEGGLKLTII